MIDIERCPIAADEVNRALAELRARPVRDGHYTLRASSGARVFSQANDAVATALRDLISQLVPDRQELLIDAYCGAGFFAKALLEKFERVIGIDWDRFAIEAAQKNASQKETYIAGDIEEDFARAGVAVFSNARNHRMAADVPLLIPEVNADHAAAIVQQRKLRGWSGCIVTNANCSATPLVIALKPLQAAFGVRKVLVTTLQAISGAGYPGVPSYDILDNAIPYISGEEEKVQAETLKMLGRWEEGPGFTAAPMIVSAHCNRVATREGHLECASIELERDAEPEEIIAAWENYQPEAQRLQLPSSPERALSYRREPDRPQTLRDRDTGRGMTVTIGRLRRCPVLSYKFALLGHNTIRGAAGGSILNAELCVSKGLV